MKRKVPTLVAAAAALALGAAALAGPSVAHGPGGGAFSGGPAAQGQFGPGMMGHMGTGVMGPGAGMRGYGQGTMGFGPGDCPFAQAAAGKELTTADVTALLERRLAAWGNDRLKIGQVVEQGEDTIVGEILTQDDSLVERFAFDRHTGRATRSR